MAGASAVVPGTFYAQAFAINDAGVVVTWAASQGWVVAADGLLPTAVSSNPRVERPSRWKPFRSCDRSPFVT